jgi:predicted aspartyl protease
MNALWFCALAWSPSTPVLDLPFESVGNRIYLKASVKGRPITAILDTGAGVSVVDLDLAKSMGSEGSREINVAGAGATVQKGLLLNGFEIGIDGTDIKHSIPVAVSLAGLAPLEGRPLEAVLGYELLRQYVVQVDYQGSRVRFYNPERFVAPTVQPVEMKISGNHPHIDGTISIKDLGELPVRMMLDTGATTSFSFTGKFVNTHKLLEKYSATQSVQIGAGVGGKMMGKRVRVEGASMGSARLKSPVASITETGGGVLGDNATFDVLVGGETLRRFTVTFDYPGKRIYFEPNSIYASPFVGDRTGLFLRAEGKDYRDFIVFATAAGGPGAEAGIREGDQILEVNGKPAVSFTLESLRKFLRESTMTLNLKIKRGSEVVNVSFVPRDIV